MPQADDQAHADVYDAAQERGEVATIGKRSQAERLAPITNGDIRGGTRNPDARHNHSGEHHSRSRISCRQEPYGHNRAGRVADLLTDASSAREM